MTDITFNEEEAQICFNITKNGLENKSLSLQLRDSWIKKNIINFDDTFEEVTRNTSLMRALKLNLGNGLSKEVETSQFGKEFNISDHMLHFNGNTDEQLANVLKDIGVKQMSPDKMILLKKKRDALNKFLRGLFNDTLHNMELYGTPSKLLQKLVTEEDVTNKQKSAEQDAEKKKKRIVGNNEDLVEEVSNETTQDSSTISTIGSLGVTNKLQVSSNSNATTTTEPLNKGDQLLFALLDFYPDVKDHGIYLFVDSDGRLVYGDESFNKLCYYNYSLNNK